MVFWTGATVVICYIPEAVKCLSSGESTRLLGRTSTASIPWFKKKIQHFSLFRSRKWRTNWNQWLVADVWATVINQELQLPDDLKVTGSYLSMWLLRTVKYRSISACVDIYHVPNVFGLFRSKIAKITAFYVTSTSLSPKLNHHKVHNSLGTL